MGPDLISGFFSAIFSFTSQFINKRLEILEIEYLRLIFRELDEYMIVAFVDEYESITQVREILDKILKRFFELYRGTLSDWDFDLDVFEGFDKEIEAIMSTEDVNRMLLIEKMGNLTEKGKENEIQGIFIFTCKGELMFSNIVDENLSQFLSKLIDNNNRISFKFDQIIIFRNNQYIIIENISDSLITAVLINPEISIDRARAVCKLLFKAIKGKIQ